MLSWTTLTPFYEEDVLYALDAPALARELLGSLSSASVAASTRNMPDLLTETEDKVSLISYLRCAPWPGLNTPSRVCHRGVQSPAVPCGTHGCFQFFHTLHTPCIHP